MDHYLYDPYIFRNSPHTIKDEELPLSAGKTTIDVLECDSFKALCSFLDRLSLGGLEFWSVKLILAWIVLVSSFSRSFTASSIVAMVSLLGSVWSNWEVRDLCEKTGFNMG